MTLVGLGQILTFVALTHSTITECGRQVRLSTLYFFFRRQFGRAMYLKSVALKSSHALVK